MNPIAQPLRFPRPPTQGDVAGFTLIELMITVAVVAILASIAYASYQDSVVKTRRGSARACLSEVAQTMERRYTLKMKYNEPDSLPDIQCRTELTPHYVISPAGALSPTSYSLQAVPQGSQKKSDTECGTLGLTHTGVKSKSGTGTVKDCW